MPAQFGPAFDFLMSNEDPGLTGKVTSDSGGLTRWGISQKAYPGLDIRNLTLEEAAAIYRNDYFKPICGYDLADQRIASKLLDMAVNMGTHEAVELLQRACNRFGAELKEDGAMGPLTLHAANTVVPEVLLHALCEVSTEHYRAIAVAQPDEAKYLHGWLDRAPKKPPA